MAETTGNNTGAAAGTTPAGAPAGAQSEGQQVASGSPAGAPAPGVSTPALPTWTEQIDPGLREQFKDFPKLNDVAKSHVELREKVKGIDGMVRIPGENASDEEYETFLQKIGVPKDPEGYQLALPTNLPDGLKADPEMAAWFRDLAYETGLLPGQARTLYEKYNERMIELHGVQTQARKDAVQKADEALRNEWKGDYDKNLELARRAQRTFGGNGFTTLLEKTGLGNDPEMIKTFHTIGKKIGEDNLVKGDPTSPAGGDLLDEIYPSMKGMRAKK